MINHCTQMRRKLVKHSTLSLETGETTEGRSEWVTEPCNTPLFGSSLKSLGKCASCERGWTHPENYPVVS